MHSSKSNYIVPPFPPFPSAKRYVPIGSVAEAMERVTRAVDAREAVSLVIGPPGTGKTLICNLLAERYQSTHDVVQLGEVQLDDGRAFFRHLLHHLGADLASVPEGDLQLALIDSIRSKTASKEGLLIIVDEAQSLSTDVIESIRMATNIAVDGQPQVMAVFCGGVKFEETLVATSMEAFTQRAATRCYLHPMNYEETKKYITATIRECGADPDETITDEAIGAAHHACSGVPRLLNQLMTQTIDVAEAVDQSLINEQIIDRAWAELQQLPSPMVEEPQFATDSSPVEFGELSDDGSSVQWNEESSESSDSEPADIQVEVATASWVEEPADEMEPVAESVEEMTEERVDVSNLFGEFEEEEEVSVGNSFCATTNEEPVMNLEAMLQSEIIGVDSLVMATMENEEPCASSTCCESIDIELEQRLAAMANDVENEFDEPAEDEAVLQVVPQEATSLRGDDSDMLVIEDEVDIRPISEATRVDGERQTISVDFHQMLSRMRSGT